jgi:hypothetical protein
MKKWMPRLAAKTSSPYLATESHVGRLELDG